MYGVASRHVEDDTFDSISHTRGFTHYDAVDDVARMHGGQGESLVPRRGERRVSVYEEAPGFRPAPHRKPGAS